MRSFSRLFGVASLLALLMLFGSGDVLGQKKKTKTPVDDSNPATDDDYAKIKKNKNMTGTIRSLDEANNSVTIRVETKSQEPNPKYKPPTFPPNSKEFQMLKQWNTLQNKLIAAQSATNPKQQASAMQAAQTAMMNFQIQNAAFMSQMNAVSNKANNDPNNQPYLTKSEYKDYTFDIEEKVVYRKLFLPTEYDDTGNLKKYTEKEKTELRGTDKTKPGYKASTDEIQTLQEVKLYLTPPPAPKKSDSKEDQDAAPKKGSVNMVVMTKELKASDTTDNKKKNK